MSEVKIILKRSPANKENGVWIDGVKVENVTEVSVFGSATETPHVVIKLLPRTIILGVDNPDIDKVGNEEE